MLPLSRLGELLSKETEPSLISGSYFYRCYKFYSSYIAGLGWLPLPRDIESTFDRSVNSFFNFSASSAISGLEFKLLKTL